MGKSLRVELQELVDVPEARVKDEESVLPSTMAGLEVELRKEDVRGKRQDREQRKDFAYHIFKFICAYMAVTMLLVFLSGCNCACFSLEGSVLITLLSTTTANVFGLFVIVAKYLFHTKD